MDHRTTALLFIVVFLAIRIVGRVATHFGPQGGDKGAVVRDRLDASERLYMAVFLVGGLLMPALQVAGVLPALSYRLPGWATWLGVAIMSLAGVIHWRAHFDLGRNYSATVRGRDRQSLVTTGVFAWIRHPIYASLWLIVLVQPLLVQHWLFGFSGAVTFAMLYLHRLPREEAMMVELFGDEYRRYAREVGSLLPRIRGR